MLIGTIVDSWKGTLHFTGESENANFDIGSVRMDGGNILFLALSTQFGDMRVKCETDGSVVDIAILTRKGKTEFNSNGSTENEGGTQVESGDFVMICLTAKKFAGTGKVDIQIQTGIDEVGIYGGNEVVE